MTDRNRLTDVQLEEIESMARENAGGPYRGPLLALVAEVRRLRKTGVVTDGGRGSMLRSFFHFTSLILTLGASGFLLKGNLSLSVENIAELSQTRFGYSDLVIENLATQLADTRVGFALLLAAFFFQLCNTFVTVKVGEPISQRIFGLVGAVAASALLIAGGQCWSVATANQMATDAIQILESSPDKGKTTWESQQERKQ